MRLFIVIVLMCALSMLVAPVAGELASIEKEIVPLPQRILSTEKTSLPTFSPAGEKLVTRMSQGFLKKIKNESSKWYECGTLTPEEDKPLRAEKIARYTLDALREYDLKWLNPWAVLAVMYSESRGDQCAIGPHSRKAAVNLKIIDPNKPFNQWTKEDVTSLMENPKWKKSREKVGADLGLGQQIWQRYARILDPSGSERCGGKLLTCRVPTLNEILSVENGPKVVATGMLTRKLWYRDIRAWSYWPGSIRDLSYDLRITAIVSSLGGTNNEKPVW